jgi:hypothetical protein
MSKVNWRIVSRTRSNQPVERRQGAGPALSAHAWFGTAADGPKLIRTIEEPRDRRNRDNQQHADSHERERHEQIQAGNGDAEHRLSDFGQKQLN